MSILPENSVPITIAIDGYSSCGKSTMAKALAGELGYRYIDSGAMYRAVTLYGIRKGTVTPTHIDEEALIKSLPDIHVSFDYNPETKSSETLLNGENVEREIRNMEVSDLVSKVSAISEIRKKMVAMQQQMGAEKAVIMDGRDIGTAVFPKAELKIFLTADLETRVYRRCDELNAKGIKVTFEEVKENLLKRDHDDTHRKDNPLRKAENAVVVDNTDLTRQQQLDYILKLILDHHLLRQQEKK